MTEETKPTTRMAHITMRLPQYAVDYFMKNPQPRAYMRDVLAAYVKKQTQGD